MILSCATRPLLDRNAPKEMHEGPEAGSRTFAWRRLPIGCALIALVAACSGHRDVLDVRPPEDGGKGEPAVIIPETACSDQLLNYQETDVDCGGPHCHPCEVDLRCRSGSDCATGACDDSFCVLASSPPFWLPFVSLSTARSTHAAATYVSSDQRAKLVVLGGFLDKQLDTYEVFDPETSSWEGGQLPGAPCCRASAATGPDGKVYFVYGDKHQTWAYSDFWKSSLAAPPPGCVHAGPALGADGLLYVLCSQESQLPANWFMTYDTASDSWVTLQPAPTDAFDPPRVTSLGSRIYVSSPNDGNHHAYDIDTRAWSKLAQFPVPTAIAGAPDGRVYAVAGFDGKAGQATAEVYAYRPQTNRFTAVAPLKSRRYDHAVTIGPDGRLYALGGSTGSANTASVEAYGPVISISPTTVAIGEIIRLSGYNFAAHANVQIYVGGVLGNGTVIGTTNAEGALPAPVDLTVVDALPGGNAITVVDDKSRYPATIRFTVR